MPVYCSTAISVDWPGRPIVQKFDRYELSVDWYSRLLLTETLKNNRSTNGSQPVDRKAKG